MTPELLASVAGIVLSLCFSYIPGAEGKWANLDGNYKRLIMLGLLLAVALAVFGLACGGIELEGVAVVCDQAGAMALLNVFIMAAIANQAAFLLSPAKK